MGRLLRYSLASVLLVTAILVLIMIGLPDRARVTAIGYLSNGLPIAPEIGGVAPALSVGGLDNKPLPLLRDRPLIVNFWATWCGPCVAEFPLLEETYQRYAANGLQLVAVNVDESAPTIQAWLARLPVTFPVALDPNRAAFGRYRVRGMPSTFFIGRDGVIFAIRYGPVSAADLDLLTKSLLDQPLVP